MKLSAFISIGALSLLLAVVPSISEAKEQSQSRHAVVGGSSHKGHSVSHRGHKKYHHGYNHSHKYKSHKHRSYKHRHHRRSHWNSFIIGAAVGHSVGIHGAWYRGHPWCPSHHIYHTHSHHYSHNSHYYHDLPKKVASYVELSENGRCYRVNEYSNGDERKKRIRDHYCADLEEWDEWDELE